MPTIPFNNTTLKVLTGIFIFMLWQLNFFSIWSMGFSLQVSLTDSLVNTALLVLANLTIMQIFQYYQPPASRFWFTFSVAMVFAILLVIIAQLILKNILTNDKEYTIFLNKSTFIRMVFSMLMTGWILVLNLLWNMLGRERETKNRREETMALAREAELFKLRQQLQPHFLFNSLNSINALVVSRPQEARRMIEQLSSFLRATINTRDNQLVPLTEEMEQIGRYLQIEKFRFGHRLNTVLETDESCAHAVIPPLLLQPLVENAIKFGLYDTIGEVTIRMKADCFGGYLDISVSNPFDPQTSQVNKGTGFGLNGLQRRLYLLFGRSDLLTTSTSGNLFITTVKIPQNYVESNNN
ncbi:sensor histidine kinase [Flavihumibacter stibioxidans]|nr:histidine kinase [Flavihumibacter stibioxidans]